MTEGIGVGVTLGLFTSGPFASKICWNTPTRPKPSSFTHQQLAVGSQVFLFDNKALSPWAEEKQSRPCTTIFYT